MSNKSIRRNKHDEKREQGCHSGQITGLPPMLARGSISRLGVTRGSSLFFLYSAPRGFYLGTPVVPSK